MVRVAVLFCHGVKRHSDVVLGPHGTGYTRDEQLLARVPNLARELVSLAREPGHGNELT